MKMIEKDDIVNNVTELAMETITIDEVSTEFEVERPKALCVRFLDKLMSFFPSPALIPLSLSLSLSPPFFRFRAFLLS